MTILDEYASSVESTKGYSILWRNKKVVVAISHNDLIVTTIKQGFHELEHERLEKPKDEVKVISWPSEMSSSRWLVSISPDGHGYTPIKQLCGKRW